LILLSSPTSLPGKDCIKFSSSLGVSLILYLETTFNKSLAKI
jgi:hypothetical protein